MTIIASIQRFDGILTISDIALSAPKRIGRADLELPLSRLAFSRSVPPKNVKSQKYQFVGNIQKTVFFGVNSFALWAGSPLFASKIIKELARLSELRLWTTLDDVVEQSGLTLAEIDLISLIVFRDVGSKIVQEALNTRHLRKSSASIIYDGTGSFPGIEDVDDRLFDDDYSSFIRLFYDRITLMLMGDIVTQSNFFFSFGGWFELTSIEQSLFSKTPYAVKVWVLNGDNVFDGPAYVSGYREHDLLIFYLDKMAKTAPLPIFIPDFLKRSGRQKWDGFSPDQPHELEFHLIYYADLKRTMCTVLNKSNLAITLRVDRYQCDWSINPEFLKLLHKALKRGELIGHRISTLSSWKE